MEVYCFTGIRGRCFGRLAGHCCLCIFPHVGRMASSGLVGGGADRVRGRGIVWRCTFASGAGFGTKGYLHVWIGLFTVSRGVEHGTYAQGDL
jgi:hypothetical protein